LQGFKTAFQDHAPPDRQPTRQSEVQPTGKDPLANKAASSLRWRAGGRRVRGPAAEAIAMALSLISQMAARAEPGAVTLRVATRSAAGFAHATRPQFGRASPPAALSSIGRQPTGGERKHCRRWVTT